MPTMEEISAVVGHPLDAMAAAGSTPGRGGTAATSSTTMATALDRCAGCKAIGVPLLACDDNLDAASTTSTTAPPQDPFERQR